MGLKGKYTQVFDPSLERRKSHAGMAEAMNRRSGAFFARKVAIRILTIGLPLYATSELGIRVALVMLVAMASNVMDHNGAVDVAGGKNMTQLLKQRKYAAGAILLQLLSDISGFTNYRPPTSVCLAYVALGITILILPPPYPTTPPGSSAETSDASASAGNISAVVSIPWTTSSSVEATFSPNRLGISPLLHTPMDVDLTILSGIIVGLITVTMYLILRASVGTSSASSLAGIVFTPCAAVLALTIIDMKSLQTSNGLGIAIGSLTSCLVLAALDHEWSVFAYQSVLIGISVTAIRFDNHTILPLQSHHDHPHHKHQSSATVESKNMSRLSAFILVRIRGWRLLEQIMVEKDSRRIFYFMW